jgi:hypothetical protein
VSLSHESLKLGDLSIESLVEQYAEIGVAQYKALDADECRRKRTEEPSR